MAKLGTVVFAGASGTKYNFEYYDFPGFWIEVAGVYIVARYDRIQNRIIPIYIGSTSNLKESLTDHPQQDCFKKKYANVLCWFEEKNQQYRLDIEDDLLFNFETPCND